MRVASWAAAVALLFAVGCSSSSSQSAAPPHTDAGGEGGADTWSNYAQGFFATYCVECHHAGSAQDFSTYAAVQTYAPVIRCGVAPTQLSGCTGSPPARQFPISDSTGTNPRPSDAERLRLVAWIEAGLPQ